MRPGIVHRLDKDTSGCMVVAKSQAALMSLQQQIAGAYVAQCRTSLKRSHPHPQSH